MKYSAVIQTFISRFLILVLSFGLIIYSTNMWGSEGKGIISLITADLAIVIFFANIFAGSSVSYFASRYKTEEILFYAYLWSVFVGITIPLLFSLTRSTGYTGYLIGLSVLSSLLSANINLFVGRKNIRMFNLYTILQLAVQIVFIVAVVYVVQIVTVDAYFIGQICCFGLLFVTSSLQILRTCDLKKLEASRGRSLSLFSYGWKTQLSAFLQFLNNRLSFYFLEFFRGIGSVGIFSIGVAFSEAIWTVSRSLAVVLYSEIVNSDSRTEALLRTKASLRLACLATGVFTIFILLLPAELYTMIFGRDFSETKKIILLMTPGIFAVAVSNIIGFYFSGINELRILNVKSFAGLIFSLAASLYAIPRWGITGACVVTSLSYCLSSGILLWKFYQSAEFSIYDFIISKNDIILLSEKLKSKK